MADYYIIVPSNPLDGDAGLLSPAVIYSNIALRSDPKFSSILNKYSSYDFIPLKNKDVYKTYLDHFKYKYCELATGWIIFSSTLPQALIMNDSVIILFSSKSYFDGAKYIGAQFANKKTEIEQILNQRFYKIWCFNKMDLTTIGVSLPEKAKWLRLYLRKKYFMFISHMYMENELPNFKEIICYMIHIIEQVTGLEIGYWELYLLSLLPHQLIPELLYFRDNVAPITSIIAESLGLDSVKLCQLLRHERNPPNYTDLLEVGVTFSKHFEEITQYIVNTIEGNFGWNQFPDNYVDAISHTYIQSNSANRNKAELEKLLLWKLTGFNAKYLKWISNLNFHFISTYDQIGWSPPLTIYGIKEISPNFTGVTLTDHGDGSFSLTKGNRTTTYNVEFQTSDT